MTVWSCDLFGEDGRDLMPPGQEPGSSCDSNGASSLCDGRNPFFFEDSEEYIPDQVSTG